MLIEAAAGKDVNVENTRVRFARLRLRKVATTNGELEVRPTALAYVRYREFEVEEGSVFVLGDRRYRVIKISPAKQIVRLRAADDPRGRFEKIIERGDEGATSAGIWLGPLIEGARILTEVTARLDDHPDTVAQFSAPLARAKRYLAFADQTIAQQEMVDVRSWLSGNLALVEDLLDVIAGSTCETLPQVPADRDELRRSPSAQRAHADQLWRALVEQFGVPRPLAELAPDEQRRAIAEHRALRFLSSSDGFGGGYLRVELVGGENAEPSAIEYIHDVYFPPPCRLTLETARDLSRNSWEKIGEMPLI